MYNEQIEALISAALADGMLTEKEKQVLFKKAQAQGIDLDEFEIILDARLVELEKAEKAKAAAAAPKSNKVGDVKKCPNCGAIVQSYQGVCAECGYAFENIEVNYASKELSNLLMKAKSEKEMATIIDTFPIPMEKAALMAFVTWLRPQSTDNQNPLANSYFKKYAECINKIKVSFANDKELEQFIGFFDYDGKTLKKQKLVQHTIKNKWFCIGIAALIVILLVLILIFKPKPMRKNPAKTNAAMVEAVEKGDLNTAEKLYVSFEKGKSYLRAGKTALCRAYINKGQLDKAEEYMYDTGLEDEIFKTYLKNKDYDNADRFVRGGLDDNIELIIKTMCENGEKVKAKRYLSSKKTMMKDASEHYQHDGVRKYNERIKNINELIASY